MQYLPTVNENGKWVTVFTCSSQNPGYYDIVGEDVSVWHVRNNIPTIHWAAASILRYHTDTRFLTLYGGNLYQLYQVHGI